MTSNRNDFHNLLNYIGTKYKEKFHKFLLIKTNDPSSIDGSKAQHYYDSLSKIEDWIQKCIDEIKIYLNPICYPLFVYLFLGLLEKHSESAHEFLNKNREKYKAFNEEIEDIQSEISDNIGILLKTHKQIANEIISKILKNIIPLYSNSQNLFEVKMGLYIADDLIEYIGQDMLGDENWTLMYNLITKLVVNKDMSIRQAAAYGIGNFAKFTTHNFDKYSKGLIDGLYNGMNIKKEEENDMEKEEKKEEEEEEDEYNEFGMSYDNMVASLGKIINYQFNSEIVQKGLNELINKWIMNLPIKYDDTEQELQHEWLVELFLVKRNLIGENCFKHYFETLVKIYETKAVNDKINEKIKYIFNEFIKKEEKLKEIVNNIYQNSDDVIKRKLEKLTK